MIPEFGSPAWKEENDRLYAQARLSTVEHAVDKAESIAQTGYSIISLGERMRYVAAAVVLLGIAILAYAWYRSVNARLDRLEVKEDLATRQQRPH